MNKKDQKIALGLLRDFVIFATAQGKAGVIDGSMDPSISIQFTIELLDKYAPFWNSDDFILSA